jgi:hypothetical protein
VRFTEVERFTEVDIICDIKLEMDYPHHRATHETADYPESSLNHHHG